MFCKSGWNLFVVRQTEIPVDHLVVNNSLHQIYNLLTLSSSQKFLLLQNTISFLYSITLLLIYLKPFSTSNSSPLLLPMSRRTSARLASLQKRPLEPDDTPIDDDTPVANDADLDDEYIPHNVRKKHNTPRKKKVKRARKFDPSLLPNELLRSIFQYCQPKMLGTLMRVCKKFEFVLRTDESVSPYLTEGV
jgi:hypothetical protein